MLLSDSPAKTAKTSINIAFLSPFHVKHRLKSHISTPLNPSALPHDRRRSKSKAYRAVQACTFHSPAFHPSPVYTKSATLSAISCRFGYICPIKRDTRQQLSLLAQCRATAHALRICLYHPLATTRRAFKSHICNFPAPPYALLYVITFRCFTSHFLLFTISFRPILRQTELIVQLNIPLRPSFARTPPDKPVRLPSSHTSSLRYATTSRLRAPYASCSRTFRQVRGSFCYGHRCATPRPTSFDSLYSRKRCRGVYFFAFSFHVEHTSCRPPKPQRLSEFLLVYAYLYTASLHVFRLCVCFSRPCDPFSVAAPRLTIAPRRRSLTPGSASRRVACLPFLRIALSAIESLVPHFSISFHLTLAIGVTFALFACTFLCLPILSLTFFLEARLP